MKYRVVRHEVVQPPDQSYRLIPLTQNQNAIVDAKDYEWLSQWNWCSQWNAPTKSFYAKRKCERNGRKTTMYMHRIIAGADDDLDTDHRNGDTLDNRRSNLRACTRIQNGANKRKWTRGTSKYKGVSFDGVANKWAAEVAGPNLRRWLGRFPSEVDAAKAYDAAAIELFGEFAKLNFPRLAVESRQ